MIVDGEERADPPLVVELELVDLGLGHWPRGLAHVGGLVAQVRLVEAAPARQPVARAPALVARRRPRVTARPAHERGGHVLAVRRRGRPPDEERLVRPPLAPDEPPRDPAGHVRGVVPRALRAPVGVRRRAEDLRELVEDSPQPRRVGGDLDPREVHEPAREGGVAPGPQAPVHVHHVVEVVVRGHVEEAPPDVEAGRDLAVGVARAVAVEPLAHERRPVARPLSQRGRVFLRFFIPYQP